MTTTDANIHPAPRLAPDGRPAAERIRTRGNTFLRTTDAPALTAAERRAFDALASGVEIDGPTLAATIGGMDPMRSVRALRGRRAHIDGQRMRLHISVRRGRGRMSIYRMTWTPWANATTP